MESAVIILSILRAMYPGMRPVLKKAVDDPKEDWDDILMGTADLIFGHTQDKK